MVCICARIMAYAPRMRILVLGAGHVGRALVDALHEQHELVLIDLDPDRLAALRERYDVRTVEGDGTSREILRKAGVETTDLLIGCSPREEVNLVCAMLVRRLSQAQVIVRTSSPAYLEAWREREIDVDFMVSSELETANAISAIIGIPAARQTDVFADGRVQIVEFDIPPRRANDALIGRPLREAAVPDDSKVAGIIRGDRMIVPRGTEAIRPGDRVVVIASPASAKAWSASISHGEREVQDMVVFGAGRMGTTIARVLLERGMRVRLVEAQADRAREVAKALPQVHVFQASAFDHEFLEHERIGRRTAAVFCLNDDARNLYGAVLAKRRGVRMTIALTHDPTSAEVYEGAGVDLAINPRQVAAEELVRFAHDPRCRQVAMFDDDRFEILDVTVRAESALANRAFNELPVTGSLIGAVVRDGTTIFPHGSDVLRAGDRVIIFVESRRASLVEEAL
jgi:trk system potassium uptake protein TrkA